MDGTRDSRTTSERPLGRRPVAASGLESLPMSFEANRGQAEPGASYLGRGSAWTVAVNPSGAVFRSGPGASGSVSMRLRGARVDATVEGVGPLRTRSNYLLGNDRSRWVLGAPHFEGLRAAGVLTGVSLRWRGVAGGRVRYDFECDAGADPSSIALDFDGAESVLAAPDGGLEVRSAAGVLRHSPPVAWQVRGGERLPVPCVFRTEGATARFHVAGLDPALPLVIDPTIDFSVPFSGNSTQIYGCGIDSEGGIVLAGRTSTNFGATAGAFQTTKGPGDEGFVVRYLPGSSTIDWSTFLGGGGEDRCWSLAIDDEDFIYLTGATGSTDFPLEGPFQGTLGASGAAFVAKLAPTGDALAYSTFLGGNVQEEGEGIAVDASGRAWVCGWTTSTDFPLVDPVDSTQSAYEGFVTCLNANGNGIVSSTLLGGTASEILWDIDVAPDGTIWIGGYTASNDLSTVSPVQSQSAGGTTDAILASLSSDGKTLQFCSYLGGTGQDEAYDLAIDADGNPVFVGYTVSTNFPTVSPLQASNGGGAGGFDAWVARLDAAAKTISFSTYFGGSASESAHAVAIDPDGGILVAGQTRSSDFPTVDPVDGSYADVDDMFVSKISADGSELLFSTYLGIQTNEVVLALATDGAIVAAAGYWTNPSTNGFEGRTVSLRFLPDPYRQFAADSVTGLAVALSWTDPHAGAYGVEVQRATGTGDFSTIADLAEGSTTHADDTVTELLTYRYRVRGTSASGDSPWSKIVTVKIPPRAVEDLAASVLVDGTVGLAWTDASSVETGYSVFRRTGGSGSFSSILNLPAGSSGAVDGTAVGETQYEYRVRTLAPAGAQADAGPVAITTPPRVPLNFSVQALDDQSVALSWQDQSAVETGFEVQRRDDDAAGPFATSTTAAAGVTLRLESGLASGNAYTWRVRTVGASGNSPWSPEVSLVTPPAPPTGVTAEVVDAESVRVAWTDESAGETGFRIERRRSGDAAFATLATTGPDAVSVVASGLLQKQGYEFRVRSLGASGASRALETVALDMPAQIVIETAKRTPATAARSARLAVKGRFDTGPVVEDLLAGVSLRVGEIAFDLSGEEGPGGRARYEEDGLRLDLIPARSGSSAVVFVLTLEGPAAEALAPDGELVLALEVGSFSGIGGARLEAGAFSAKKGVGERATPSLALSSFRARLGDPGLHSFAMKGVFRPYDAVPATAPDVRVEIGGAFAITLAGAEFTAKKGKFLLREKGPPGWNVTVDPLKGTISLKGVRLSLGEFPAGAAPVRIGLAVGDRRFEDELVLVSSGRTLSY